MSGDRTVAAALLDTLAAHGIDTCFGIPGVHNLALWNALAPGRPRILGVRHEQAAGYACDGMYRATGRPGAALLTSGPGAANIVAAFGEAYTARSPMLVLASDVGTGLRRPGATRGILHEMRDQAALFSAFGAWARTAWTPQEAVDGIGLALTDALRAPGAPAYLGVASDVLDRPWDGDIPGPHLPAERAAAAASIDRLAALLRDSPRVVLWLGGGVTASGTEAQVRSLARRTGAAVVTSFAGRGLLAGDPQLVDAPVHEPEVAEIIAAADLLLVLGSDVDAMNTRNWRMPVPPRLAAVALGDQVGQTFDWDLLVRADLRQVLPALAEATVAEPARSPWVPDAAEVRGRVFARLRQDPRLTAALELVTAVETAWPPQDAVVGDMAVAGFWATLYAHQARPRRAHYPVGWGTLGYGLPAAMGPASQGIPTLCVAGDGGPMFALGELAAIAQESLPVTLLVVDDGGYGMLRFDQQVFGHPERGVDLLTPDWVALAASFGIVGAQVPDGAALPAAFAAAREANGRGEPRLLVWRERLYPPRTTSPRWFEG
jgi:thiamine pyrophosphate-dependent acetolactate synthase large subunit-like protein